MHVSFSFHTKDAELLGAELRNGLRGKSFHTPGISEASSAVRARVGVGKAEDTKGKEKQIMNLAPKLFKD